MRYQHFATQLEADECVAGHRRNGRQAYWILGRDYEVRSWAL